MDIKLGELLRTSLEGTYLEFMGIGNENILKWALSIDPETVVLFESSDLTKAMYSLTQYSAFLQAQLNAREATFIYEKRKFGRELSLAICQYPKGTVNEREAKALKDIKELQLLESRLVKAETDFLMFRKMPESILEKVNVLKKEMSRRGVDK